MVVQNIVVGIGDSGSSDYLEALHLAAQWSRRGRTAVTLVNGYVPRHQVGQMSPDEIAAHDSASRTRLHEAGRLLSPMLPLDASIDFHAVAATGTHALLDAAYDAKLVVLQRRDVSRLTRTYTGSTSTAVAAQADCPVLVARADQSESAARRGVVVGVGADGSSDSAVRFAFDEAAARRVPVIAVHVWQLRGAPSFDAPPGVELRLGHAHAEEVLSRVVGPVAADYPAVNLVRKPIRGLVADGLISACSNAELLVLSRHRDRHLASVGLGRIARHSMVASSCPVVVVPHGDSLSYVAPTRTGSTEATV